MRLLDEVGRRLARAADAGELGDLVRRDAVLEEALDEGVGDRVVAAAGAERRLEALVDLDLDAEAVLRLRLGGGGGFLCGGMRRS